MTVLFEARAVKKYFQVSGGVLHAVDGVSVSINRGETLGVVGESGCGKSTFGRVALHLLENTGGQLFYNGKDITRVTRSQLSELRRKMQIIFQDPFSSLNPRMTVSQTISEPMRIAGGMDKAEIEERVYELMSMVGLARRLINVYPHELDGGRRQRIGIARALALRPEFIVCDEPVSALDVSIQAQILNLMQDIQEQVDLTYIFITHDLSVVKYISDNTMVMYLGEMVELAPTNELFERQFHPYTRALLSAVPVAKLGERRGRVILKGELTSPVDPGPGCRFAARCIHAHNRCHRESPEFREISFGHSVRCHFAEAINQA